MLEKLQSIAHEFDEKLNLCGQVNEVLDLKSQYLGKKGALALVLKGLKDLSGSERQTVGQRANLLKQEMLENLKTKTQGLEREEIDKKLAKEWVDVSLLDRVKDRGTVGGGLHPITQMRREIESIFISMSFKVLTGPEVEDDYHNFKALNIPEDHPARDMQDTFWLKGFQHLVMRTHTSPIQIRGMANHRPPFKFIGPGKVYRSERTDASHDMVFHQVEGMMVDKDLSVAHLIYCMKTLLKEIFKKEVKVRLRPGYFPFVEPGFELDMSCMLCQGKGCSACKGSGWLELLPCGMVHPNVLSMGGVDPKEYSGFAFGLGLDRLVMMRYGIEDIRHFHSGDLRFVSQFKSSF